ncbi:MAG: PEP-CTERM sorting domain-containing protein [Phycisphaerales bacterium]|nr:PEP-CTERM sorting domain-containing protein [Phycisphaerales bacterium]
MSGRHCIAGAMMFAFASTGTASGNMLLNGDFETGQLTPWFASDGTPWITSDESHSGTYSAAAYAGDAIRQDFAAVSTDDIQEVSIWVMREGGAFNQYSFYYADGTTGTHLIDDIGGGDNWTYFELTQNLVVGKFLVGFQIYGTTEGPSYMDDVRIDAVPAPAALALLGIAGMAGRRRRRF